MADIKLMVMYPCPHDIRAFEKLYEDEGMSTCDGLSSDYAMSFEAFERLYHEEHVPMIVEKLVGKTRFVATKVIATPDGAPPPFYRIAEIHFPSLEALQTCAQSAGGKETLAHAGEISSGGAPTLLLAEEQTFFFGSVPVSDRLKAFITRHTSSSGSSFGTP